jgi:hypothetical protein
MRKQDSSRGVHSNSRRTVCHSRLWNGSPTGRRALCPCDSAEPRESHCHPGRPSLTPIYSPRIVASISWALRWSSRSSRIVALDSGVSSESRMSRDSRQKVWTHLTEHRIRVPSRLSNVGGTPASSNASVPRRIRAPHRHFTAADVWVTRTSRSTGVVRPFTPFVRNKADNPACKPCSRTRVPHPFQRSVVQRAAVDRAGSEILYPSMIAAKISAIL